MLSEADISVEYLYAFVAAQGDHAYTVIRVEDNAKTEAILAQNGFTLLDDEALRQG